MVKSDNHNKPSHPWVGPRAFNGVLQCPPLKILKQFSSATTLDHISQLEQESLFNCFDAEEVEGIIIRRGRVLLQEAAVDFKLQK